MLRRTTSAHRNVNYQELQKEDDEFIDSQVGYIMFMSNIGDNGKRRN
jgi:hypothetical protein